MSNTNEVTVKDVDVHHHNNSDNSDDSDDSDGRMIDVSDEDYNELDEDEQTTLEKQLNSLNNPQGSEQDIDSIMDPGKSKKLMKRLAKANKKNPEALKQLLKMMQGAGGEEGMNFGDSNFASLSETKRQTTKERLQNKLKDKQKEDEERKHIEYIKKTKAHERNKKRRQRKKMNKKNSKTTNIPSASTPTVSEPSTSTLTISEPSTSTLNVSK